MVFATAHADSFLDTTISTTNDNNSSSSSNGNTNFSSSSAAASSSFPHCVNMNRLLWVLRHDPTAHPPVAALFALLYSLIVLVGVCGNGCVLLAIGRTRSLQTVSNLFIFALSCSDIVVCCVSATFTPFTAFKKVWVFGQLLCSLVPFIAVRESSINSTSIVVPSFAGSSPFQGTSLCFSTFTLAAISIDRFLLIQFPLSNQLRHRHALCIIMVGSSLRFYIPR